MILYKETDDYYCRIYKNHKEWLKGRHSIGGSDASSFIDMNPYKTAERLWEEKKGLVEAEEITNDFIEYGNKMEPVLRSWFKASQSVYKVQYKKNCILQSKEVEWRLYSPDGLLYSKEHGKGILEIKTMLIRDKKMYDQWKDQVPNQYYVQVLHGLLATKFDYVIIVAELRFAWERNSEIVVHKINRSEVIEDLEWLDEKEKYNWNEYYIKNVRPPVIIEF